MPDCQMLCYAMLPDGISINMEIQIYYSTQHLESIFEKYLMNPFYIALH